MHWENKRRILEVSDCETSLVVIMSSSWYYAVKVSIALVLRKGKGHTHLAYHARPVLSFFLNHCSESRTFSYKKNLTIQRSCWRLGARFLSNYFWSSFTSRLTLRCSYETSQCSWSILLALCLIYTSEVIFLLKERKLKKQRISQPNTI